MAFLNSDWATRCFNGALPGCDKLLPVSLCGQRGAGVVGAVISAGKAQTEPLWCDVIAAVGWWLGWNLSSWSLISKSGLDLSLNFSLLPFLSRRAMSCFQLFFQQRDNYRLQTQLMNKCVGFSSMDRLVREIVEAAVINTLRIRPCSPVSLMCPSHTAPCAYGQQETGGRM